MSRRAGEQDRRWPHETTPRLNDALASLVAGVVIAASLKALVIGVTEIFGVTTSLVEHLQALLQGLREATGWFPSASADAFLVIVAMSSSFALSLVVYARMRLSRTYTLEAEAARGASREEPARDTGGLAA